MELENERKEIMYKYDLTCSDQELLALKKIAIERFSVDEAAQLEYAVRSILAETVDKLASERLIPATLKTKKAKKENKNGSTNINRK